METSQKAPIQAGSNHDVDEEVVASTSKLEPSSQAVLDDELAEEAEPEGANVRDERAPHQQPNGEHQEQPDGLEQEHGPQEMEQQEQEQLERRRDSEDNADPDSRIENLEAELARVTDERDGFETQYRNLLGKLTNMRNTLGDKLRQDADELDRREQQIVNLQAANDDLSETIETLKSELIASNEDSERLHTQMEQLRLRADDSARAIVDEASAREAALREATEDLERCRLEREDWENQAMKERVGREELETSLNTAQREIAQVRIEKQQLKLERDREAQSASNLHAVLEEFQNAKDKEIKATLGDIQVQLQATSRSLVEYRQRAQAAEAKLSESQSDSERSLTLQKEVREKNLLIGKLRHEAVILNEHLTEALRRLKKDSGENSVDRRLVTNVLLQFVTTPRADSKRFEMLSLLASILSWSDEDRERAGLQRIGTGGPGSTSGQKTISVGSSRRRALSRATSAFKGKGPAEDTLTLDSDAGMEQSFSNLWVEYLLKEAQAGSPPANDMPPNPMFPPISSPTSPGLNTPKSISPFAELARPTSPTKSSAISSAATAGKVDRNTSGAPPISRSRSETAGSETASIFSKGDASSTAPTSVASGYK